MLPPASGGVRGMQGEGLGGAVGTDGRPAPARTRPPQPGSVSILVKPDTAAYQTHVAISRVRDRRMPQSFLSAAAEFLGTTCTCACLELRRTVSRRTDTYYKHTEQREARTDRPYILRHQIPRRIMIMNTEKQSPETQHKKLSRMPINISVACVVSPCDKNGEGSSRAASDPSSHSNLAGVEPGSPSQSGCQSQHHLHQPNLLIREITYPWLPEFHGLSINVTVCVLPYTYIVTSEDLTRA